MVGGMLCLLRFVVFVVAPIKALCTERYTDWNAKFGPLGLICCELTGDTEIDDYFELQHAHIITTTPVCVCVCVYTCTMEYFN